MGVVDDRIKQALKAETVVCCLSDETLLKNQKHHPDLQLDDYLQINKVLQDYDILVQDTEKTVVAVKKISGKIIGWQLRLPVTVKKSLHRLIIWQKIVNYAN